MMVGREREREIEEESSSSSRPSFFFVFPTQRADFLLLLLPTMRGAWLLQIDATKRFITPEERQG